MIERFYLQNNLTFDEVELNLSNGLIVFTGPSGSGKSVLMRSILGSFGLESSNAKLSESSVIENDELNVFKQVKKEKTRFFINNQAIPKKNLLQESLNFIRYLNIKDFSDFDSHKLLDMIDMFIYEESPQYLALIQEYKTLFDMYQITLKSLEKLFDDERKILELKEFAQFEINKIESVNPQVGEDERLQEVKRTLSKKEKIEKKIASANQIFEFDYLVSDALTELEVDSAFFDDGMNELRMVFDKAIDKLNELDELDVEDILDRIEALSSLKKRHGSIEAALEYLALKKEELKEYNSIEIRKDDLILKRDELYNKLYKMSEETTTYRENMLNILNKKLNSYIQDLYLENAHMQLVESELSIFGKDTIEIRLADKELSQISSGEFNRLRLALLALKSEILQSDGGVLMLDEIDANLSGEESMSVAKVLKILAKRFQIFAISHQPQLSSMADYHYLVKKENNKSSVTLLEGKSRVLEIARMVSAGDITQEAIDFASKLLEREN